MTRDTLRRHATVAVGTGVALLLTASPSFATTFSSVTGDAPQRTVTITGDEADDRIALACVGNDVRLDGSALEPITAACDEVSALLVQPGPGDDLVDLGGVDAAQFAPGLTQTVNAGDGQDQITGGSVVDGGGGNDRFIDHAYTGSIAGGDGTDVVEYDFTDEHDVPASFTIGATSYTATLGATVQAPVTVGGVEQYVFSLPDGSDAADRGAIDARGTAVRVVARMHAGVDSFEGGSGNDFVDAGPGIDTVNPGSGNDSVQGGEGGDAINVQDGEVDVVDCGDGPDTVTADRSDVLKNCENVTLPPLPAPNPPAPTPTPAPTTSAVVGTKKIARGGVATFAFVSPDAGARFECKLDNRSFTRCASPYKLRTKNLKVGKHTLVVRALLSGGNVDASPSRYKFSVTKAKKKRR